MPRVAASSSKRGKKNHLVARVRSQRKSSTKSRDEIVDATQKKYLKVKKFS